MPFIGLFVSVPVLPLAEQGGVAVIADAGCSEILSRKCPSS
jgi:hypothetical protein